MYNCHQICSPEPSSSNRLNYTGFASAATVPLHPGVIGRDPMLCPGIVRRFVNDRIVQLGRQMCSKTAQDARQFFVRRFLAPLGFQMHLSGCELDPFRTLKVQWGHPVSSTAGVGSRSVRYRWIFVLKTAQDARHFLPGVLRSFR